MKKAIILVNAYTQSDTELNQPNRLKEELQLLGRQTEICRHDFFPAYVAGDCLATRLEDVDFCVYLDKDPYYSQILEGCGVRLFNCARAVFDCDDKMQTNIRLAAAGIPVVKTFSSPLCYTQTSAVNEGALDVLERELSYPIVVKECFGSLGKGVYLAENREQLSAYAEKFKLKPHIYQQFIAESAGVDVRVIAIGGEALVAMKRSSKTSDFRSNIELGGRGELYPLDDEIRALCGKISRTLSLDYCGIDLLFTKDGYAVCEVNSNAFFGGIEKITGVNVAKAYAEYINQTIYGGGK